MKKLNLIEDNTRLLQRLVDDYNSIKDFDQEEEDRLILAHLIDLVEKMTTEVREGKDTKEIVENIENILIEYKL